MCVRVCVMYVIIGKRRLAEDRFSSCELCQRQLQRKFFGGRRGKDHYGGWVRRGWEIEVRIGHLTELQR